MNLDYVINQLATIFISCLGMYFAHALGIQSATNNKRALCTPLKGIEKLKIILKSVGVVTIFCIIISCLFSGKEDENSSEFNANLFLISVIIVGVSNLFGIISGFEKDKKEYIDEKTRQLKNSGQEKIY